MEKFSQYKLELASLPEGEYKQEFVCDTAFFQSIESIDVIGGEVRVSLSLLHKNGVYDCHFSFDGEVEISCDRCLEAMSHRVDTDYDIIVKYGEEYDDTSDEVLVIPDEMRVLDISSLLHDTIVLTIPIRHVHPEGECDAQMASRFDELSTGEEEEDEE